MLEGSMGIFVKRNPEGGLEMSGYISCRFAQGIHMDKFVNETFAFIVRLRVL